MHGWFVLAVASMASGCAEPIANVSPEWELVWADEFDGDALDRIKWSPEETCLGGSNYESQCYTDPPENIEVSEGLLRRKGRKEQLTGQLRPPEIAEDPNPTQTQEHTSGKVRRKGRAAWKYGRIEVCANAPFDQPFISWSIWQLAESCPNVTMKKGLIQGFFQPNCRSTESGFIKAQVTGKPAVRV